MPQAKHTQKPRKAWLAVQKPRIAQYTVLEPGGLGLVRGGGEVLRFHGKSIHFPWNEIGLSSLHLSYGILERSLPGKVGESTLHDVGCQECPNIKPI